MSEFLEPAGESDEWETPSLFGLMQLADMLGIEPLPTECAPTCAPHVVQFCSPECEATDDDLPGMWSKADFTGGDPDERSYAERGWL